MTIEDSRFQIAKERVMRLRRFYVHLATYILVNALLLLINVITTPDILWFVWPLLGWGIGIAFHAISVFGFGRFYGADWEEKKIKEILE